MGVGMKVGWLVKQAEGVDEGLVENANGSEVGH